MLYKELDALIQDEELMRRIKQNQHNILCCISLALTPTLTKRLRNLLVFEAIKKIVILMHWLERNNYLEELEILQEHFRKATTGKVVLQTDSKGILFYFGRNHERLRVA